MGYLVKEASLIQSTSNLQSWCCCFLPQELVASSQLALFNYINKDLFMYQQMLCYLKLIKYFLIRQSILSMKQNNTMEECMTEQEVNKRVSGDTLDLSIRHFSTIENLSHLKGLKNLNLSFNNISTIGGLSNLIELEKLYLEHNLIEQTKGLEKNKNLKVLNLGSNKIEKIEGLSGLVRLERLDLSYNRISKLSGVETQKLVMLNVSHNLIESLDYMPVAPRLEELLLAHNKLTSINSKVFNNCDKVIRLDLSHNTLRSLKFLEFLPGIEELNISNNLIESIDVDCCFDYLETLNLSGNRILELPYLHNIAPQLMNLDLSNNSLTSDTTLIQAITDLDSLLTISFAGNPFYEQGCEEKYAHVFKLETINGKEFLKAGAKFAGQITEIVEEWKEFPELYMRDEGLDQEDISRMNDIKKDGFYDPELEIMLIGQVTKRPGSPKERYQTNQDKIKFHQQMHHEIEETSNRINYLKMTYREILKKHNIPISKSETFITDKTEPKIEEVKLEKADNQNKGDSNAQSRPKSKGNNILSSTMSLNEMNRITEAVKADRRASVEKWKELKNKDKVFNPRDSRRKVESREENGLTPTINSNIPKERQKPGLSLPKINSRTEKPSSSSFVKTQTNHFQAVPIQKVSQTYRRPLSFKKS